MKRYLFLIAMTLLALACSAQPHGALVDLGGEGEVPSIGASPLAGTFHCNDTSASRDVTGDTSPYPCGAPTTAEQYLLRVWSPTALVYRDYTSGSLKGDRFKKDSPSAHSRWSKDAFTSTTARSSPCSCLTLTDAMPFAWTSSTAECYVNESVHGYPLGGSEAPGAAPRSEVCGRPVSGWRGWLHKRAVSGTGTCNAVVTHYPSDDCIGLP